MPKSAIFCGHANECPNVCPCDDDCYCRDHTCRHLKKDPETEQRAPLILGVCGVAGSGKDTTADFLVEHRSFLKIALADPLKRIAADVYQFTRDQLWGPSEARNKPDPRYPREHGPWVDDKCRCCGSTNSNTQCFLTPRYALQALGTEWGRVNYQDTWVDLCLRIAPRVIGRGSGYYTPWEGIRSRYVSDPEVKGIVISDVRFRNEITAIQKAGGRVVRVRRPGAGLKGASGLHQSEIEQLSIPDEAFDEVTQNDSTLEVLLERTLGMIQVLSSKKASTLYQQLMEDL